MTRLERCLDKISIIDKDDAALIKKEAAGYVAEGMTPIQAAIMATRDALEDAEKMRASVTKSILKSKPDMVPALEAYWNGEDLTLNTLPEAQQDVARQLMDSGVTTESELSEVLTGESSVWVKPIASWISENQPVEEVESDTATVEVTPSLIQQINLFAQEKFDKWQNTDPRDRRESFSLEAASQSAESSVLGSLTGPTQLQTRRQIIQELTGEMPKTKDAKISDVAAALKAYRSSAVEQSEKIPPTSGESQPTPTPLPAVEAANRKLIPVEGLSPIMTQYAAMRNSLPDDVILMYRLGDFYEVFFDDAKIAAPLMRTTVTKRGDILMTGIPYHAKDSYIKNLLSAGHRVAFADQVGETKPGKLTEREVTEVLTPQNEPSLVETPAVSTLDEIGVSEPSLAETPAMSTPDAEMRNPEGAPSAPLAATTGEDTAGKPETSKRRVSYTWLSSKHTGTVVGTTANGRLSILPDGGNGKVNHTVSPDQVEDVAPLDEIDISEVFDGPAPAAPTQADILTTRGIITEGLNPKLAAILSQTAPGDTKHRAALASHDTSTPSTLLASLAKSGPKKFQSLARLLQQFDWSGITLTLVDDNIPVPSNTAASQVGGTIGGVWLPDTNQILIMPSSANVGTIETVLHEMIHAATEQSLNNPNAAQKQIIKKIEGYIKNIKNIHAAEVKKQTAIGDEAALARLDMIGYGISDNYEFLAHMLTSESFRASLESLPKGDGKSFVQLLFDTIADLLLGKKKIPGVNGDIIADLTTFVKSGDVVLGVPQSKGDSRLMPASPDTSFNQEVQKYVTGNWPSDPAGRLEELGKFADQWITRYGSLKTRDGERIAVRNGIRRSGDEVARSNARIGPDGNVTIRISRTLPKAFARYPDATEIAAKSRIAASIYEEIIHSAELIAAKRMVGPSQNYGKDVDAYLVKTFDSVISELDPTNMEAVTSSVSAYLSKNVPEDYIRNQFDDSEKITGISELVRQVIQLRHSGDITESVYHRAMNYALGWMQKVLDVLRDFASNPALASKTLDAEVKQTEAVLDELGIRFSVSPEFARSIAPAGTDLSALNFDQIAEQLEDVRPLVAEDIIHALVNREIAHAAGMRMSVSPVSPERLRSVLDNTTTGNPSNSDRAHFITNPEQRPALISYLKGAANAIWDRLKERFDTRSAVYVDRLVAEVARAESGYRVTDGVMHGDGTARFSVSPSTDKKGNLTFKHVNFVFANDKNKLYKASDKDITEKPGWIKRMFARSDDMRKSLSWIKKGHDSRMLTMESKFERLNPLYERGVKDEGTEEAMARLGEAIGDTRPMLNPEAEARVNDARRDRFEAAYALRDNEQTAAKSARDAATMEAKRVHDEAMKSEDPGERADAVKAYTESLKTINAEFRRATEEAIEAGGITDLAVEEAETRAEKQKDNARKQRDLSREQAKQEYDDEVQSLDAKVRVGARNKYEIILKQLDKDHDKLLKTIREDLDKLKHSRSVDAEVIAALNEAEELAWKEAKIEMANHTDAMRQKASNAMDWLEGNAPQLHKWAKEMRETTDEFQTLLHDNLLAERPDLAWAIDNSKGVYLVRSYRIHQDPAFGEMALHSAEMKDKRDAVIELFSKDLAETEFQKLSKDPDHVNRSEADLRHIAYLAVQPKAISMFQDLIMGHEFEASKSGSSSSLKTEYQRFLKKRNLDEAISDILGRIDDPQFNANRTLQAVSGLLFNQKLLTSIKEEGLESGTIVDSKEFASNPMKYTGWEALVSADVHSKSYAPLAGYYAPAADAAALRDGFNMGRQAATGTGKKASETINNAVLKAATISLLVKTLGSVGYFSRGLFSGPIIAVAQGVNPLTADYLKSIYASAGAAFATEGGGPKNPILRWLVSKAYDPAEVDIEFREKLVALGVLKDGAHIGYIRELKQKFETDPLGVMEWIANKGLDISPKLLEQLKKGGTHGKAALQKLEQLAEFTETTPNVAVFLSDLKALIDSGVYKTLAECEQEAARINKAVMTSKSQRSQGVKAFSGNSVSALLAPFVGYKTEMFRTVVNTYREGWAHARSGNPVLRAHGIARLGFAATVHAGFTMLVPLALQSLLGFDDDEDKAVRAGLPSYSRSSQLWMWKTGDGSLRMMDMTFANPFSFVFDPGPQIWRSRKDPLEIPEIIAKYIGGEVLGENIAAGAMLDVSRNNNEQRGGPIWFESDDFSTKVAKGSLHILKSAYSPALLNKSIDIYRATDRPDKQDEDFFYTPLGIALGMTLPTKPNDRKLEDLAFRAFRELGKANGELALITGPMTSKAAMNQGTPTELYNKRISASVKIARKAHDLARSYVSMGMSPEVVMKALTDPKGGSFSKERARLYIKGMTEKYVVPADKLREIQAIDPRRWTEVVKAMRSYGKLIDVK